MAQGASRDVSELERRLGESSALDRGVDGVIAATSSLTAVVVFLGLVLAYVAVNELTSWIFDPYPYVFLTLILSVLAIGLAQLVLRAERLSEQQDSRRNRVHLRVAALDERETTAVLRLLLDTREQLGLPPYEDAEVTAMLTETRVAALEDGEV